MSLLLSYFVDQSGRSGETASPVRAIDVAGVESGTGLDDLAFARIISGRRTGECTSRLGLPSGEAYVQALRSDSPLELTAVQENSFYTMIVEHTRAVTDSARGSVLLLRPVNAKDQQILQKGVSGSVVELRWEGRLMPAAMILSSANDDTDTRKALRFDRIREAFETLEASLSAEVAPDASPASGPAFDVVSITADVADGASQLASLKGSAMCRPPTPRAGTQAVEIVLTVEEPGVRSANFTLWAEPHCGPAKTGILEGRKPGSQWEPLSTSCAIGAAKESCRVNRASPYEVRLKIGARNGWVGLSGLILE